MGIAAVVTEGGGGDLGGDGGAEVEFAGEHLADGEQDVAGGLLLGDVAVGAGAGCR